MEPMQRGDAERIFALVAELGGDLRGRIVSERWWLIWIVLGGQILLTASITQWLLWHGETRTVVFVALWGAHVALIAPIIFFIHRGAGGQRTATELYIWWIWTSFILCGGVVALFNQLAGLPIFFTAPVLALLAAFAFSIMAMVTHRFFLIYSVLFLAVMVAMSLVRGAQFLIFGGSWAIILISMGVYFRATQATHLGKRL
ncbi:MAG: hypothetical protein ACLQUY_26895 [Ktedonobacterales bacterium]